MNCQYCIHRNKIAEDGQKIVDKIESLGASEEITNAVTMMSEYMKTAEAFIVPTGRIRCTKLTDNNFDSQTGIPTVCPLTKKEN